MLLSERQAGALLSEVRLRQGTVAGHVLERIVDILTDPSLDGPPQERPPVPSDVSSVTHDEGAGTVKVRVVAAPSLDGAMDSAKKALAARASACAVWCVDSVVASPDAAGRWDACVTYKRTAKGT